MAFSESMLDLTALQRIFNQVIAAGIDNLGATPTLGVDMGRDDWASWVVARQIHDNTANLVLRDVRDALHTPEGEDIVQHARDHYELRATVQEVTEHAGIHAIDPNRRGTARDAVLILGETLANSRKLVEEGKAALAKATQPRDFSVEVRSETAPCLRNRYKIRALTHHEAYSLCVAKYLIGTKMRPVTVIDLDDGSERRYCDDVTLTRDYGKPTLMPSIKAFRMSAVLDNGQTHNAEICCDLPIAPR
jgi:hypothetical protein